MEILISTLAYTTSEYEAEALTHIRFIFDTLQSTPGLISARFYRSQGNIPYYLFFITWQDEESWQKAQEHHNPRELLLNAAPRLLTAPPEQWYMHYLWGYHRPIVQPTLAAAHIATVSPDQVEKCQQGWLQAIRQRAAQSSLGFAFLARGSRADIGQRGESITLVRRTIGETTPGHGSIFLNLFSWSNEAEKRTFYASSQYQALDQLIRTYGVVRILQLEPL